jgi:hypothetical protein
MPSRSSRANRRDENESAIVSFWRDLGCDWIEQSIDAGFDGLLFAPNGMHIVEIKNPLKKWKLTDRELITKSNVEFHGEEYHIVQTIEDSARVVGREIVDWETERIMDKGVGR